MSTASITNIILNQRLSRLKLKTQISVLLLASEYIWLARDNKTGVTKIYPGVQRGIRFHSPPFQEVSDFIRPLSKGWGSLEGVVESSLKEMSGLPQAAILKPGVCRPTDKLFNLSPSSLIVEICIPHIFDICQ